MLFGRFYVLFDFRFTFYLTLVSGLHSGFEKISLHYSFCLALLGRGCIFLPSKSGCEVTVICEAGVLLGRFFYVVSLLHFLYVFLFFVSLDSFCLFPFYLSRRYRALGREGERKRKGKGKGMEGIGAMKSKTDRK